MSIVCVVFFLLSLSPSQSLSNEAALLQEGQQLEKPLETTQASAESSFGKLKDYFSRGDVVTGFTASFVMVLTSELGDKTFFIAAIMAMTHSRLPVFIGSYSALVIATVLSALLGSSLQRLPHIVTHVISIVLFVFFGLKMLKEAYDYDPSSAYEGLEEADEEIAKQTGGKKKKEKDNAEEETTNGKDIENGNYHNGNNSSESSSTTSSAFSKFNSCLTSCISPVILQAFTMTTLAECGDRSQIATVVLATTKNVVGVTLGGLLGHAISTATAVIGGKLLASKISERIVWLIGGFFFLFFAVWTFFHPED